LAQHRRWRPTYIAIYTQHTGLLGLSPSLSFTVVSVVDKPVTFGLAKELSLITKGNEKGERKIE
jgi:hypothetical protein